MQQKKLYSLRIKIISCHFKQKQLSKHFILKCYSDGKLLQSGFLNLAQGFITNNISLNMQISSQEILQQQINITMLQKKKINCQNQIGGLTIDLNLFDNYKLRRIPIKSRIYKNAFIEAFVLLFPLQMNQIPKQIQAPSQMPIRNDSLLALNHSESIILQENQYRTQAPCSLFKMFMEDNTEKQKKSSEILQINELKVGRKRDKKISLQSNEVQTQTFNIESLMTLNNILTEQNTLLQDSTNQLTQENLELQFKIDQLEEKIKQLLQENQELLSKSNQNISDVQIQRLLEINQKNQEIILELNDKIKRLQKQNQEYLINLQSSSQMLINKDEEIINKKNLIANLMKKCKQLENNLTKTESNIDIENRAYSIDEIVQELSKYSETAKKYKNNERSNLTKSTLIDSRYNSKQLKSSRLRMQVPKMMEKSISFMKPSIKNMTKEQSRRLIENKERFNQETTYSLTQSKINYA